MTGAILGHSAGSFVRKVLATTAIAAALAQPVSAKGQMHQIAMKDIAYAPVAVTVHVGDTVEWDNADIVAHTATSKTGGFDVIVPPGGKGSTVVARPGTFAYTCRYHPNMKGQLIVKP